jgi:hypothetical protein
MYRDSQGVLTEKLYGEKIKAAWKDDWPNYHLEVKSSSGAAEPFHVSRLQIQHVSSFDQFSIAFYTDCFAGI